MLPPKIKSKQTEQKPTSPLHLPNISSFVLVGCDAPHSPPFRPTSPTCKMFITASVRWCAVFMASVHWCAVFTASMHWYAVQWCAVFTASVRSCAVFTDVLCTWSSVSGQNYRRSLPVGITGCQKRSPLTELNSSTSVVLSLLNSTVMSAYGLNFYLDLFSWNSFQLIISYKI